MKKFFSVFMLAASIIFSVWSCAWAQSAEPLPQAPQTSIPYKKEEAGNSTSVSQAFLTLLVLLGVAGVGIWAVKRYYPHWMTSIPVAIKSPVGRRIKVIESLRLNPKTSLYLVERDGRVLLLAQSGDHVCLIDKDNDVKGLDKSI